MATWSAGRLLTRLREVIEGNSGTLRVTIAGAFEGKLPPGLSLDEEARRALLTFASVAESVPVECRVVSVKRSAASPPVIGNLALYDIVVEARALYPMVTESTLTDSTRDVISGLAAQHADTLAQALGYPGNLLTTNGGQSTGLVSGLLSYQESAYEWAGAAGAAGTLTARHRFKGVVQSAPAVS